MSAALTDRQRAVLEAICDALLPCVEGADESEGVRALGVRGADSVERAARLIASIRDHGNRARLQFFLSSMHSRWANLVLAGRFKSFVKMDRAARESFLEGGAYSRVALRRAAFQAIKRLVHISYYCWPVRNGSHPAWRAVGYPGPLPPPSAVREPPPAVSLDRDTELECDVVVVGSGAGGGVVAGLLSEAGRDVVVLERGPNPGSRDMTQVEGEMLNALYLDHGLIMTQSGSMPVLAGSCVGGGTVINYTTSFPLPEQTRRQWDDISGLHLFGHARFAESLDRVCTRLNVGTAWTSPGTRDALLERGCRALGWHVDVIPRNVTDCREGLECGYCGYGCRHGAKNSTADTYLSDAVRAGTRIVARCEVERVLSERGRATGVTGTVTNPDGSKHRVTVRARAVVAAAGAIYTPALLVRSGLENRNIGRGLRLHPATAVVGIFPERVEPWSGGLQTRYSDQFADLHDGYGAKFETAPVHFALPASAFGWEGASRAKEDLARLAHLSIVGVLLRDRDAGRITVTRQGLPRIHYELSRYDVNHLRVALRGAAQVLAAAGATEVMTLQTPPARIGTDRDGWLEQFARAADRRGYRYCRMSYITFHQMASASMGLDPARSVVGETGESHEMRGLYVADGSTFPTSSGVNPMITIMAIADHVAHCIQDSW